MLVGKTSIDVLLFALNDSVHFNLITLLILFQENAKRELQEQKRAEGGRWRGTGTGQGDVAP